MTSITVQHASKRFDGVQALDDVSLEVAQGERVAILGPSGSGKTTLLRLIAGLSLPDAGEVLLDGVPASRPGWAVAPHRRGIGFVFQTAALWPHMTVAQNILFGLGGRPRDEARARLHELLAETGLADLDRRYPDQLSGGQARRVALARALAPGARRLLMDEPLTHLEPELRDTMLGLIDGQVTRSGASLVYVTHDAAEAARIADRVLALRAGRLGVAAGG